MSEGRSPERSCWAAACGRICEGARKRDPFSREAVLLLALPAPASGRSPATGGGLQVGDQRLKLIRLEGLAEVLGHDVGREARGDLRVRVGDRLGDLLGAHALQSIVEVGTGGAGGAGLREGVAAAAVGGEELRR